MSNLTKVLSGVLIGILVVALALLAYNAYNKNAGPTWLDDIFQGNVTVDPIPVDTGFKVYTTNNGLVVTNPSNGVVSEEEGTIDYSKSLYIDMTFDNGYYSEKEVSAVEFTINKNGSGCFLYTYIDGKIPYFYNQYFSNGNTAIGYLYYQTPLLKYDSIETSNYLRDITILKDGTTYNFEPKYSVYNINAFIYNLCAYAVSTTNNGYATYVVIVDVTDYFTVTSNGEEVTKPVLFSYTVNYGNKDCSIPNSSDFVSKVFEMTTNK